MNFKEWKNNIIHLKLQNIDIKNNIISFFKEFRHSESLSFIFISDDSIRLALNNINNYKSISICLDIEFQSVIMKDNKYLTSVNLFDDKIARFIREFGMLFFLKDITSYFIRLSF